MKPRKAVYLLVGSPGLAQANSKWALGLLGQAHKTLVWGKSMISGFDWELLLIGTKKPRINAVFLRLELANSSNQQTRVTSLFMFHQQMWNKSKQILGVFNGFDNSRDTPKTMREEKTVNGTLANAKKNSHDERSLGKGKAHYGCYWSLTVYCVLTAQPR